MTVDICTAIAPGVLEEALAVDAGCCHRCGRPHATADDQQVYPDGQGAHLCWWAVGGDLCVWDSDAARTRLRAVLDAVLPQLAAVLTGDHLPDWGIRHVPTGVIVSCPSRELAERQVAEDRRAWELMLRTASDWRAAS